MYKVITIFLLLVMLSCASKSNNFLLDDFSYRLSESIPEKEIIRNYKNQDFNNAVSKYKDYDKIFVDGINAMFQDTILENKFRKSFDRNGLYRFNPADGYLIAAIYHRKLNKQKINLDTLRKITIPL